MLTTVGHPTPWSLASSPDRDLLIRRATDEDVVELAALKRQVERRCYAGLGSPAALAVRLHRRCTAWYLLSRLAEGELVLLAEHAGALVGLGAARIDPPPAGEAPRLHLHSTYVGTPGLGIGRALTHARLEAAARLGLRTVTADCLVAADAPTGPAEQRLRRLGLREQGPRTPSPTYPGAHLSHWAGSLHTALESVDGGAL